MAKVTKSSGNSFKTTFGRRKKGKPKKNYGPKENKPKKYKGQGRS